MRSLSAASSTQGAPSIEGAASVDAAAPSLASWSHLGNAASPSRRDGASLAYDARNQSLVLWGGTPDDTFGWSDETWLWSASTGWQKVDYGTGTPKPHPVRGFRRTSIGEPYSASMTYVEGQGVYLLIDWDDDHPTGQLWLWSGTDWTLQTRANGTPTGPISGGLVTTAGSDGLYAFDGWLWRWNGKDSWAQLSSPITSTYGPGFAVDPASGSMMLVGGYDANFTLYDFTLLFSAVTSTWTRQSPNHNPDPGQRSLLFDRKKRRAVDISPLDFGKEEDWDGHDWSFVTLQRPFGIPASPSGNAFAYDADHSAHFVFGGQPSFGSLDCCKLNALWQVNQGRYDLVGLSNDLRSFRVPLRAFDKDRQRLVVLEDAPNWTREFDGQKWSAYPPPSAPTLTAAMAYDSARKVTVLYTQASSTSPDMCAWNGSAWACQADWDATYHPNARMAFDEARGQMVLFASADAQTRVTELWDGKAWTAAPAGTQPPARSSSEGMAYDVARKRIVLPPGSFTANNVTTTDDSTWEWDGSRWTEIHAPGFSTTGGVTYSYERNRVVSLSQGAQGDAQLLEWRGDAWASAGSAQALASVSAIVGVSFPGNPYSLVGGVSTAHTTSSSSNPVYYATDLFGLSSTVAADDFAVSVTPGTGNVVQGKQVTFQVATASTKGAAETLAFEVEGLPSGVSGSFSPTSVTAGTGATLTLTAAGTAPSTAAAETFTVRATAPSAMHTTTAQLSVSRCVPLTACPAGDACGSIPDGCGGTVACGTCAAVDSCHTGTCSGNACTQTPVADGKTCDDGNACTTGDACTAGKCGGAPVVCTNADACHEAGTCQAATGKCSAPVAKKNGTTCDDGNACTTGDMCTAGVCGGSPVVCTNGDPCNDPGTCQASTGACSAPVPKSSGTPCNDGNACTQKDACDQGKCVGSQPVVCAAADACHVAGTCEPATGACANPIAANGTSCSDPNKCVQNATCNNGTCGGSPLVCVAEDECHAAGTCASSSGVCSNPIKANGTPCSVGACLNGVCTPNVLDGGTDSGSDAGSDSGTDAGADSGTDAGADSGQDAGVDSGTDAGADSGQDAGVDSGFDAGTDSGLDAGKDAAPVVHPDSGTDSGIDAGTDSGAPEDDASVDSGIDAGPSNGADAAGDSAPPGSDSGEQADASGAVDAGEGNGNAGGCSCRTVQPRSTPSGTGLGVSSLALALVVRLRRRKRSLARSAA